MLQHALFTDAGKRLLQITYMLEGDGALDADTGEPAFLAVQVSEQVDLATTHASSILSGVSTVELDKICSQLTANPTAAAALSSNTRAMLAPAFKYMDDQLRDHYGELVGVFRCLRILNPVVAAADDGKAVLALNKLKPKLVSSADISDLRTEWPAYKAAAQAFNASQPAWSFWVTQKDLGQLPGFFQLACRARLLLPSSAAAERVFSLLKHHFNDLQYGAYQDYRECAMLTGYNNIWRGKYPS